MLYSFLIIFFFLIIRFLLRFAGTRGAPGRTRIWLGIRWYECTVYCVGTCTCVGTCLCMWVGTYGCAGTHTCPRTCTYIRTRTFTSTPVDTCACMCVFVRIYLYIYMYRLFNNVFFFGARSERWHAFQTTPQIPKLFCEASSPRHT